MTTSYDETVWEIEPADPSTGIWTHTWTHLTCSAEYEQGVQESSTLAGREVRRGAVYAQETYTLSCGDCGAHTTFSDETFMGLDGEAGI